MRRVSLVTKYGTFHSLFVPLPRFNKKMTSSPQEYEVALFYVKRDPGLMYGSRTFKYYTFTS